MLNPINERELYSVYLQVLEHMDFLVPVKFMVLDIS